MAWYRTGTVAVTNGSPIVIGTGTAFVANVQPGHAINLPDGRVYEVLSVQSDTQLTLGKNYLGATANGQAYEVQPNQGFAQAAAARLADFIAQFGGYVSTVLAGLFGDGTQGRPGIAFVNDQDTGLRRTGENAMALTTGGVDRLIADSNGNVGVGTQSPSTRLHAKGAGGGDVLRVDSGLPRGSGNGYMSFADNAGRKAYFGFGAGDDGSFYVMSEVASNVIFGNSGAERARIETSGNLVVGGTTSSGFGASHRVSKNGNTGDSILSVDGGGAITTQFFAVGGGLGSGTATAVRLGTNGNTGRSMNAGGTINASGADYAEYMTKADGCGPIAKGDVCGVDRDGKLTRTWAHALSFMVKSTDPNLVGGDAWSQHLGPRPEDPGDAPVAPVLPTAPSFGDLAIPTREPDEDNDAFAARLAEHLLVLRDAEAANAAYQQALEAFQERSATYPAELADHTTRRAAYEHDLPIWEAELEAARATVDRIAYCGQTPVNVDAETLAACQAAITEGEAAYLVAVANGGGIGVQAVREAEMTVPLYMRRIGKVLRIGDDDRPVVDVQHG